MNYHVLFSFIYYFNLLADIYYQFVIYKYLLFVYLMRHQLMNYLIYQCMKSCGPVYVYPVQQDFQTMKRFTHLTVL